MECFACSDEGHLVNYCPSLHFSLNLGDVVKQIGRSELNFRKHFRRNNKRKKFFYKIDKTLIQSSALALRDIIFLLKEEGFKEQYRIDLAIEDFLDENADGYSVGMKIKDLNDINEKKSEKYFHDLLEEEVFEKRKLTKPEFQSSKIR